jgi:mono/diheme cytochrome c family protein
MLRASLRFGKAIAWAATVMLLGVGWASADERVGETLATNWCSDCHAVAPDQRSPNAAAPRFVDVAKDPAATENALRTFLRTPHSKMPNIILNQHQIGDVVSYILSLKR